MAKTKKAYVCSKCGEEYTKWNGKCSGCGEWNAIKEIILESASSGNRNDNSWTGNSDNEIKKSHEIDTSNDVIRIDTKNEELNRVLGGGLTVGSVTIVSGDPGVGKSTLLIQVTTTISNTDDTLCLYVTGEESLQQVKSRADRLKLDSSKLLFLSETNVESIINKAKKAGVKLIVIDSIQTIYTNDSNSVAGSSSQVRDSAAKLTQFAKQNNITILLVGHVTKDGTMAGPKVLEHMVDASLHLEGESNSRYRVLRAPKNRFGEVNEVGIFAMTETGLKEVKNPSAIFINSDSDDVAGSAVFVSKEGNRPLLFEVQSLVTESFSEIPKRLSIGINFQRISMILAIMQKYNNIRFFDKDVYINLIGGIQIPTTETSSDLGVCFSIYSSIEDVVIPKTVVSFGEISLSGEIRPVPNGEDRIKEADKHGFKHIFVPRANYSEKLNNKLNINIYPVKNISEAISKLEKIAN